MCGICGVISDSFSSPEEKVMQHLLYVSALRGRDSTGVFSVAESTAPRKPKNATLTTQVSKTLTPSPLVILDGSSDINKIIRDNRNYAVVGHCRAATKGSVSVENAHPFDRENVVGVHNGTVNKLFKNYEKFGTDSEGIYALIDEMGVEAALNEIESFTTAYALVWFDRRTNKINFIKNKERPLFFTYFYGTRSLMFASEREFLQLAAERTNMKINNGGVIKGDDPIFTLTEHHLMQVDATNPAERTFSKIEIKKPVYRVTNYSGQHSNFWDSGWQDSTGNKSVDGLDWVKSERLTRRQKKALAQKEKQISEVREILLAMPSNYEGKFVTIGERKDTWTAGCCLCNASFEATNTAPEDIKYLEIGSGICSICQEQHWVQEYLLDPAKNQITCN